VSRPEVTGRRIGVPKKSKSTDAAGAIAAAKGDAEADTSGDADDADRPSALSLIKSPPKSQAPPRLEKAHHLDKRAERLIGEEGNDDDLLSTSAVALWLGVSCQWLELGRSKNYGPKYKRLSPRVIRYRRGDIIAWLKSRTRSCTADYAA
jgi:predicted DNA-binding transcriptional regulator AlpA